MNKAQWTAAVDQLMRREWCIGIEDAGIDEQQLTDYWRDGQTPAAFLEWFAEKYDLIRFERSPSVRTARAMSPRSGSRQPPAGA
ncbi:hypothetical protein IWC96_00775 [Brevundimonas sp. BAL450]|jgi:hypothetical protein|uniref:hypothetical protein n=1 Tax=Brevundimonas TaxID=41275 RepID=UPI0011D1F501|nr:MULTISPECIES: hypothetical protein [Brevundimonas]MBG7613813.1 hypothetical protein [Brevundimonas sp. BAL450]